MLYVPLGMLAGVLTTVAGLGGGMLLLLALSLVIGPRQALATTAPALLLSNIHRSILLREQIDKSVGKSFALGAIPGSLLGGLLITVIPERLVSISMVAMTFVALGRTRGWWAWKPTPGLMIPAAGVIGMLSAAAGGAGLLVAPLLLSVGLTGERYVATVSISAVALHSGRIVAYGAGGLMTPTTLSASAVLAVSLLIGNTLGVRVRKVLPQGSEPKVELGALCVAVVLSLAGLHG